LSNTRTELSIREILIKMIALSKELQPNAK